MIKHSLERRRKRRRKVEGDKKENARGVGETGKQEKKRNTRRRSRQNKRNVQVSIIVDYKKKKKYAEEGDEREGRIQKPRHFVEEGRKKEDSMLKPERIRSYAVPIILFPNIQCIKTNRRN